MSDAVEHTRKSFLRIMWVLIYSAALGSALAVAICWFPVGVVLAPFGLLFGPFYIGFPLMLLGLAICVLLDIRGQTNRNLFVAISTLTSTVYGFGMWFFGFAEQIWVLMFFIAGLATGWIYWHEMYGEKGAFRIV